MRGKRATYIYVKIEERLKSLYDGLRRALGEQLWPYLLKLKGQLWPYLLKLKGQVGQFLVNPSFIKGVKVSLLITIHQWWLVTATLL